MRNAHHFRRARGFTLPEVLVASAVLGVALAISVQVAGSLKTIQREAHRRRCALAEADNWLERLTATPWNELTPECAAELRLSETAGRQLPHGELRVEITPEAAEPPAKRICVEIQWRDSRDRPLAPLRQLAWVHRHEAPPAAEE